MFTVRKNYPSAGKALIKVRKMTLFFSRHNSHRAWERSTFNSKANFFASKVHILIVFLKKYSRLAYLLFIWAPKRLSKSGWNGKTMSKGLKTRRELAAEMKLHSTRHVMDARASISIFEMEFPIFFYPTGAFMATSFIYFWVQGARKYLRSFGMLVLAWGSHF